MSAPYLSQFTPSLMTAETLEAIFVQREAQAQRIEELIIRAVSGEGRTHFLLYGPRGIGKTHLISLIFHRLQANSALANTMRIAWLREEERGVTSITEMLLRVLKSLQKGYPRELTEVTIAALYDQGDVAAIENAAKRLLAQFATERTLILIAENLDDIFNGLGKTGQGKLRAWLENTTNVVLLAATPSMKTGSQDPVKRIAGTHTEPFYGFFRQELLSDFTLDEAVALLQKIATLKGDDAQERFLKTEEGRERVQAVHHLAGGNPRVYVILAQFLVATNLDDLTQPFLKMLDDMTPYYQSRLATLSPQQNQIMEFLCQYRAAVTVSEIAKQCLMTPQSASSQLKTLKEIGYVRLDTVGRESYYELREPLMRLSLEVKESRGGPIPLLVDFLRLWFSRKERQVIFDSLSPNENPIACMYFKEALSLSHITPMPRAMHKQSSPEEDKLWELITAHQLEEAQLLAEEIIEKQGQHPKAISWFLLGSIQDDLNRYESALSSYDEAIRIDEKNPVGWHSRGIVLGKLNRHPEALASFDRAIQGNESDASTWYNRGIVLDKLDCYKEELESYEKAVKIDDDYYIAWHNRGVVLHKLNRYDESLASFDRAIAINKDYAPAWNSRGTVLDQLNRHDESLLSFDKAIQLNSSDDSAWNGHGITLGNLDRYDESLTSFNRAIQINAANACAWHNRGVVLKNLSCYQDALASYDKAIQIDKNSILSYFDEASIFLEESQWELFVKTLVEALSLASDNSDAQREGWFVNSATDYCTTLLKRFASSEGLFDRDYLRRLVEIYAQGNALIYLGQGLTRSVIKLLTPETSNHTTLAWLKGWQDSGSIHDELTFPLQVLDAAVRWKTTRGDRRVLLSLPEEIRSVLQELIRMAEDGDSHGSEKP